MFDVVNSKQSANAEKKTNTYFFADVETTIHTNVGEKAELPCLVYGIDLSSTVISWWKAGDFQEISLGLEARQHRFFLPRRFYEDWTLVIENTENKDTGFYACQINSDKLLEKIFYLNVTGKVPDTTADAEFLKDEELPKPTVRDTDLITPKTMESSSPTGTPTTQTVNSQTSKAISHTFGCILSFSVMFLRLCITS
uniref:Immunoglobulin domain n=3 Tax=Schistocephalus solidus TaxID=70667 RepID=A0A0X3Q0Y4_SCHSO